MVTLLKKSWIFYLIIALLTLLVLFQLVTIFNGYRSIEPDLLLVSEVTGLRASIQRYSKLVVIDFVDYQLESTIDSNIKENVRAEEDILAPGEDRVISRLSDTWDMMKTKAREYIEEDDPEQKQTLKLDVINLSESLWNMSDDIILKSQSLSKNKFYYMQTLVISIILSFAAVITAIVIYRQTVVKGLEKDSIYDPLTRAFNRRYLNELMEKEISRVNRGAQTFSLIMLDIDFFKVINDTHGHGVGDIVLKDISKICMTTIRKYDSFARIGGEEFVIFLPNTNAEDALKLAERLRIIISEHDFGEVDSVTSSFSVTQFRGGEQPDDVLKRADSALYDAKNSGRNKCVLKY